MAEKHVHMLLARQTGYGRVLNGCKVILRKTVLSSEAGKQFKKHSGDTLHLKKHEDGAKTFAKKGKSLFEESFPSLHASLSDLKEKHAVLPDKALKTPLSANALTGGAFADAGSHVTEEGIREKLEDTAYEMQHYLEPEGRSPEDLRKIKLCIDELDRSLTRMSGESGGLSREYELLQKSLRRKAKKLEKLISKNAPVNPEALRSFEETGAGIASGDAASMMVSGMLECCARVLGGESKQVEGMGPDDLDLLINEVDAMRSRRRSTKVQQSLGLMEQESVGDIIARPNRVLQEAFETELKPQLRPDTKELEENDWARENRRENNEQDAFYKKHEILHEITRANRNNLKQKQEKDGLEAARAIMHNGERKHGFSPFAAMGLGGNLYRGFTGMGFMMGMTTHIADRQKKGAEIRSVIERYLGLDQLYRNFMTRNSDIRNRSAFLQRYGREGNVRVMIQKEADRALGIKSPNKMNAFLMKQYAEQLWRGAFLKEDGSLITEKERKAEAPEKKKQRKLYADMLRAMGFHVRYPSAEGEAAGFSAQAVFSRFISCI